MSALYCPSCKTTWPDVQAFECCPKDQTVTRFLDSEPGMSLKDAKIMLNSYLEFEKFLAKRERGARAASA